MPIKDMTGQRFGRLIVVEMMSKTTRKTFWKCVCECGNEKVVRSDHLKDGHVQSCGCYNIDAHKTHGLGRTRLYNSWIHMIHRCYDPKDINYKNYGARGITVCNDWKNDFITFTNWASENDYSDHLTIDRIDVNGNYEPSNCRWATKKEQDKNKRTTVYVFYNGKRLPLLDLSEITGIDYKILAKRHFRGDRGSRLIRPIRQSPKKSA